MQNRFDQLVADVMPIYMIMPRYSHNYALFYQLLDSNLFTHRNIFYLERSLSWNLWPPGSIFHHISFQSILFCNLYFPIYIIKVPKLFIISIRSHFCKWLWRDWQPLYRVGCEVLVCLCRYEGLACSLLLDWYLGSQKLREILTLLCCITLSSSRENQRSAQEVARTISGAAAGEPTHKSRHTKYPSQTLIPRITLFAICLSFSSPPLHPCRFIRPLFRSPLFHLPLASIDVYDTTFFL